MFVTASDSKSRVSSPCLIFGNLQWGKTLAIFQLFILWSKACYTLWVHSRHQREIGVASVLASPLSSHNYLVVFVFGSPCDIAICNPIKFCQYASFLLPSLPSFPTISQQFMTWYCCSLVELFSKSAGL